MSLLVLLMLVIASPAAAAPGDPDPSFNGSGARTYDPRGFNYTGPSDVAIQPNGKILLVGTAGADQTDDFDLVVLRLNPDGSPDGSFGLGGVASLDFSTSSSYTNDDNGTAIALQSDGKIVVTGYTFDNPAANGSSNQFAVVARLNADGTPDSTFGASNTKDLHNNGELHLYLDNGGNGGGLGGGVALGASANDVVVRPDGRILIAGGTGNGNFFALQLTADGSRDTTFGDYGRAFSDFGGTDVANRVALAPNGDAVLAGYSAEPHDNAAVARLSASGAPVSGFGSGGGQVSLQPDFSAPSDINDVVAQPDGKLVFAVTENDYYTNTQTAGILRLNADGSSEPLAGKAFQPTPAPSGHDDAGSVGVDSAGRLLLSTLSHDAGGNYSFRLSRFTTSGSLDTGFGHGAGFVSAPVGKTATGRGMNVPYLALQADGRMVLAGTESFLFDVRRFLTDPPSTTRPGGRPSAPSITKLKLNRKKHSATLTFRANGATAFQCALIKLKKHTGKHKRRKKPTPHFSSCHSPKTYKHLKPGKYVFEVRALNAAGAGDAAGRSFKLG